MTGPEHYRRAERYLAEMESNPASVAKGANEGVAILAALAQAHATLALAAATALCTTDLLSTYDYEAWYAAAGTPVPAPAESSADQ